MPPCPSGSVSRALVFNVSHSILRTTSGPSLVEPLRLSIKAFATSAIRRETSKKHDTPAPKLEALTVLHKATKVLPRVLASAGTSGFPRAEETAALWDSILADAHEDLSAKAERPVKIAVFEVDEWSGAHELVTALLADPLSSDATQDEALRSRWKDGTRQEINISHGPYLDIASSLSSFQYPSNYLTQFDVPIELKEYRSPASPSSRFGSSLQQITENPGVFEADIPIIVCNPLTTPLSTILRAQLPSNTIIVLTTTVPQSDLDAIVLQQTSQWAGSSSPLISDIVAVDPGRAIKAIETLQEDPSSLSSIQRYQLDFVGSRISKITESLRIKLAPKTRAGTVRTKFALDHVSDVLRWARYSVRQSRQEIDKMLIDVSQLREKIEETRATMERDLFGRYEHTTDKMVFDEVQQAVKQTEKEMQVVLSKLTWWRMIWRADELSNIVGSAVTRTWCRGLESKLALQTGRLAAFQDSMTQSGFALLTDHPKISTALLRNSLLQLKASPNYRLTVDSLMQPLITRRNQIIEYPTMRLHLTGQRAVLGMTGGILSGIGIGWAGWLGWLLGSGEGLLGFVAMDTGTAVGVGLLSAMGSVRWAVGRWEKGKKRWWQDWARVAEGLDRDLKANLHDIMHRQVVVVAGTAAEEMSKLAATRKEDLAAVEEEVGQVQSGLNDVIHRIDES